MLMTAAEAFEICAAFHDGEAEKLKKRLDRAMTRRDVGPTDIVLAERVLSFGGSHVGEMREALRDEIALHEMSAKAIRALASKISATGLAGQPVVS